MFAHFLVSAHKAEHEYKKDHMLDVFPGLNGLYAYQTDHNLVAHIGAVSSLRNSPFLDPTNSQFN